MPERDFYDVTDYLAYPLVAYAGRCLCRGSSLSSCSSGSSCCPLELPRRGLAGAWFMLGVSAEYVTGVNGVALYSVEITPDEVRFDCRSDAVGAEQYQWLFAFRRGSAFGTMLERKATHLITHAENEDVGEGCLVLGDLEELLALDEDIYYPETPIPVEPALIQNLADAYVKSINLANDARACPMECGDSSSSSTVPSPYTIAYVQARGLVGDPKLREGYNAQVIVDTSKNAIQLKAGLGIGDGKTCVDYLIGPDGFIIDPGDLCRSCTEFIRWINGLSTQDGHLVIQGGPGVDIVADPAHHRLYVRPQIQRACGVSLSSSSSPAPVP